MELSDEQIGQFVADLHGEIDKMNFSVADGTTIIGYSGVHGTKIKNGQEVDLAAVAEGSGGTAMYISNLPAGEMIGVRRSELEKALTEHIVGDNSDYVQQIISGTDAKWIRLENAGTCGFGNNLPALDDYVSKKLMGETKGANSNLIVFIPQDPSKISNFDRKVFTVTEAEQIFNNDTFQTINGIPKDLLRSIYEEGEVGRECVYNIIYQTSQQVVGSEMSLEGQSKLLSEAISAEGSLTPESNTYSISKCYDASGSFVGVELTSKNQESPLMKAPESTVKKEAFTGMEQSSTDVGEINLDADEIIQVGENDEKLTISENADGTISVENGVIQESVNEVDKAVQNEMIR